MKYVFIHGYTSNPNADWYPQIRTELEKLGHEVVIPAMPGHKHPPAGEWVEIVKHEVESSDELVVLVGHSLGTRAVIFYLENSDVKNIEKVLLIAPPDFPHRKSDNMWQRQIDAKKLQRWKSKVTVLLSKNDRIVSPESARAVAKKIDAKLVEVDGHGHFTKPRDAEIVKSTLLDLLPS